MAKSREKVVVAMSGGVDSSVAACLLVEQGYDVVGLFMRTGVSEPQASAGAAPNATESEATGLGPRGLKPAAQKTVSRHQGCCSASDAADARFVAGMLDIPFYVLNFKKDFDQLIDYFADEYARGRTPNPCIVCNDKLKFGRIVEYADAVGAKYIATGHYARIGVRGDEGTCAPAQAKARGSDDQNVLMRGIDHNKDQSYVLFGLDRAILDRVLFPIGELTKPEVRRLADRYDLPNRDKPDSVEICFVPDRDYARVVRERRPDAFAEGDVLDETGRVVGRHGGIPRYTIGQRRGLGIAAGKPIYVTQLDVLNNRVTVGDGESLLADTLIADRVSFLTDMPAGDFRATVKIRYLHKPTPATVEILSAATAGVPDQTSDATDSHGTKVRVVFDEPQRAITPGQAVVFYDGDVVLGGAWIEKVEAAVPAQAGGD